MAPRALVGTSGFSYRHWRHVFYPKGVPASRCLEHYASHFNTVEINSSFYRLPAEKTFTSWAERVPSGFVFALKASRYITHVKRLVDAKEPLDLFLSRARLLGDKLGPVLYQLPPRWHADPARLRTFLELLPVGMVHVFEFRDDTWFADEIVSLLERYGVWFCIHDLSSVECPRIVTSNGVYVRFHGPDEEYGGRYAARHLSRWASFLKKHLATGRDVYAYFNNDAQGYAVANARCLREMLRPCSRAVGE